MSRKTTNLKKRIRRLDQQLGKEIRRQRAEAEIRQATRREMEALHGKLKFDDEFRELLIDVQREHCRGHTVWMAAVRFDPKAFVLGKAFRPQSRFSGGVNARQLAVEIVAGIQRELEEQIEKALSENMPPIQRFC